MASSAFRKLRNVVLVDGARLPFNPSGSVYNKLVAYDLARLALSGILTKSGISPKAVDYVLMGTVIQEVKNQNIARDAGLSAGIPKNVPSHTVTQACISSNQAICSGINLIQTGQAEVVIAGGVETMSDVPIKFSKPLRERMLASRKAKGLSKKLGLLKGIKLKDLAPEAPSIANFITGEVMGHSSDRLADAFGVSRRESDEFALRSHHNAAKAHADGLYDEEVLEYNGSRMETGVRGEATMEKLSSLKAAFVKPHGTVTAANASYLTDGAAATLIMSEDKAKQLGFQPKAYLREWTFVSCDPFDQMLLGPAYATNKVLGMAGMALKDFDVIEFHEAFAGQVLSNVNALNSQKFFDEFVGGAPKVGEIDFAKFNTLGGSLSIGHPFGATGARLVTTVANRLIREDKQFGITAACADGGIGHASIIERYPGS
jgi:acetyl-CoA acetyltransferase family protein